MKKILALALSVLMIFTCFVGCKEKTNDNLTNAVAYLENMYQTGKKDEPMTINADKEVLSVVTIEGISYNVEWAVTVTEGASDAVKIGEAKTENCVLIDIPELSETDVLFTATATVKDEKENTATAEFGYKVLAVKVATGDDVGKILDAAYALAEGAKMDGEQTLTGKVKSVDTPYSAQYKNVTVTIAVEGYDDKPVQCFRLAGEGVDTLAVGDTVTVTGNIINYKGKVQFDAGCTAKNIVKGAGNQGGDTTPPAQTEPSGGLTSTDKSAAQIVAEAYALEVGKSLPYIATLTGEVISISEPYNSQYGSVSALMVVEGKEILCYRMKGTGADTVNEGAKVTVTGVIKNYNGIIEFTYDEATGTAVSLLSCTPGAPKQQKTYTVVDSPVAGTAYKFGMIQSNVSADTVYYLKGGMSSYYMATITSADNALDVYLEETAGGYYLYTNIGGVKTYINMVVNGTHVNGAYEAAASTVYTFDATNKTLVATVNDAPYWFGTRNDKTYTTVGPCKTEYQGFFCKLYQ